MGRSAEAKTTALRRQSAEYELLTLLGNHALAQNFVDARQMFPFVWT